MQKCRDVDMEEMVQVQVKRCRGCSTKVQTRRYKDGAEVVQSRCRDAEAVQRFIKGDYVGEGAEVLQMWCSPRIGA